MVVQETLGLDGSNNTMSYRANHVNNSESSRIKEIIIKGKTVFLTGATGFLGKLLVEKILRSSFDVKKICILVREKKGKDAEFRKKELFENEIFALVKQKSENFLDKIELIPGDMEKPNLGMKDSDVEKLISEVNLIFNVAATVRFDEKLRTAVNINVKATKDLMTMARQMKNLLAFVHISTAYSHCPSKEIEEKFYESPINPNKLIDVVNALDDEKLAAILPVLLGKWPNTYAFTKAVAEEVIRIESAGLPVALVRPSIVISTYKEPFPGWIDNYYGATGIMMAAGLGLIRSIQCCPNLMSDIVPADIVINCIIASAWDTAIKKKSNSNDFCDSIEEAKVYNCVTSPEKPITWGKFMEYNESEGLKVPSELCIWYYMLFLTPNPYLHTLLSFLLHTVPAYMADFVIICFGRKARFVKGYQKINKFSTVLQFFSMNQWKFTNTNTQQLWKKLSNNDKEEFFFSVADLNWDEYFSNYIRGCRIYLLKDPIETLEKGRIWHKKLKILHYFTITILALLFIKLIQVIIKFTINNIKV